MIGPDQDLHDFPPWIWPYINVARLAEFKATARVAAVSTAVAPRGAVDAHVYAVFAAAAALIYWLALRRRLSRSG